ncbi:MULTISPECIES: NDxxF motif lipoprotein [Shouchella]|uniref:NDxxF motif lipoprotein n=1 Tax=Shouchella TaxID=2893057 RepID=UPI00091D5F69|nr:MULTISPECIES: NDxxF motif lipoprotein [Shouchella]MBX0320551.1 NDxxF motif lipoprotein [Shouchella clausii]SHL61019.1 hypothetical protein SAMN05192535_2811 [Shouchella rhizosphaerae]
MKRIVISFFIIFVLAACSQEETIDATEDDTPSTGDVEIPSTIFTSEKNNDFIDEEEIKQSIKTYLDSSEDLYHASGPFEEIIDAGEQLTKRDLAAFNEINELIKENDENFSNYILNNTLPEGYQEEAERISQYMTASNQYLYELNDALNHLIDDISEGNFSEIDFESLIDQSDVVNGKEQKKIEEFLDEKNIHTNAFGREE